MMAENAAHITSAISDVVPSIFEALAQESLMSTVKPAFLHIVKILAENRPDRFGALLRWYDEIYTTMDCILQNYCLHSFSASFAENFYGLKRVETGNKTWSHLRRTAHLKSLILLVLFPYIKQKLDKWFEEMRHNSHSGHLPQNVTLKRLYRAFVAIYPYIHMSWEGCMLGYQLAYMFGKCRWHSPLVQLSGTELCYSEEDEVSESSQSFFDNWKEASMTGKLRLACFKLLNVTAVTVSSSLSVGVFFLQFLEWWYSSESNTSSLMALPIPDEPVIDKSVITTACDVCPLCLKKRTNDTALSTSGFVFCYPCIYDYIKQHRCCPVTSYPSTSEHLIKLYPGS